MPGRARLCSADALLSPAVAATVRELNVEAVDTAAVKLAERLAAAIDSAPPESAAAVLERLSGRLLAVLVELGATPRARAQVGRPATAAGTALSRLRGVS
ncbi:terminase small subunit [Pseudonocardia hydrocarbonoxydans]|uniref:Terminase small subunit actinomycetes phage-type domain-containing protein n=1 Tax=Pseudonocardia hydrocarbonoxydans TaxID=76726 RepID=A0A4Y3WQ32_9PSEU|nr:hypothetical protein PHY01_32750 [Pseudonocardia hydrocarbonoxydans]